MTVLGFKVAQEGIEWQQPQVIFVTSATIYFFFGFFTATVVSVLLTFCTTQIGELHAI